MTSPSILIIEDDIDIQTNLRRLLEGENYLILTAENGREALDLLETNATNTADIAQTPGLILLDLMMPVMDGRTFVQTLRRHTTERLRKIPVVVISASSQVLEEEGIEYLRKPFHIDELLKLVDQQIKKPH